MKIKLSMMLVITSLTIVSAAYAANVTNNITGVGPSLSRVDPYLCIQNAGTGVVTSVAPGQTVDGNAASGNAYYVGAVLRFGGCDGSNAYLGFAGFNVSATGYSFLSYTAPQGVHVGYMNPAINSSGSITGQIQYTPIDANFSLPKAPTNKIWSLVGINLSGLEFSKMVDPFVIPNLSAADASGAQSDLADTTAFIKAGMNTVRVPVRWAYLQPNYTPNPTIPTGPIDSGPGSYYDSYVKPLLESLSSSGINTIVDLHSYMHYSIFGQQYAGCGATGACPDGTEILDPNAYVNIWTQLYTLMQSDPKINMNAISFDLNNEPVVGSDQAVFDMEVAVIKALRAQGFQGNILVEGNSWSGLHSWVTGTTNAQLFSRANFAAHGITDLSHIIINVHQYLDSDYSGTHASCLTNLHTTGLGGFNLDAFADYLKQNKLKAIVTEFGAGTDSSTCAPALTSFLNYLQTNAYTDSKGYGFVGWTIWSTGHGWGNYNLRVTPSSYQMGVLKNYLG